MLSDASSKILENAVRRGYLTLRQDELGRYREAFLEGTDEELIALCELTDLVELSCDSSSISDGGFCHVARLVHLRRLSFPETAVSGDAFDALRSLKNLTEITCNPQKSTVCASWKLANCPSLRRLDLSNGGFANGDIRTLFRLPCLESLSVGGCSELSDGCFEGIRKCSHLLRLVMPNGSNITDVTCGHISQCMTIQELFVGGSISGDGLEAIGRLPHLKVLSLMEQPLSSSDILRLGSCTELEDLTLCDTKIDDGVVEFLLQLPALKTLDVVGTRISTQGIARLSRHAPITLYHDDD
jgi:Leucine-rich repeat (LRR) protein